MSLVSSIVAALIAAGHGTAGGTDIFAYRWPPSPLSGYLIIPMGGSIPSEVQGGDGIDYPGFQVQVRDPSMETAEQMAEQVRLALNGITAGDYTIFTTRSHAVDLTSPDDLMAGAYRFSADFETIYVR